MSEAGSADARKLYVLGHPVAHSKSPVMYNAVYERMGLAWHYGLMDCETEADAQAFLQSRDFLSVNITTPYKPLAFASADVKAASAQLAKGANVLVEKDGMLLGYNVDGEGCVGYLERRGVNFSEASVAVCGTGPTALAILHAVVQAGAAQVLLLSRDKDRARSVLEDYVDRYRMLAGTAVMMPAAKEGHLGFREAYDHASFKFGSYQTSTQAIAAADVVIDATTLGMHPGDPAPFDTGLLSSCQTVFDVVYGHGETALISAARQSGCSAFDGAGMLVAQAVATLGIVCDVAEVPLGLTFGEAFDIMAEAAGFREV